MLGPSDVRTLALALPEAEEAAHFEKTSYRVRGKIFCTVDSVGDSLVLKLDPEDQHNLVAGRSDAIAPVTGAWGRKGWTQVRLEAVSPEDLAAWLRLAWLAVAPKRLAATLSPSLHNAG